MCHPFRSYCATKRSGFLARHSGLLFFFNHKRVVNVLGGAEFCGGNRWRGET